MTISTIIKAEQASDFLAAIPALLGHQPSDSVVVVPFRDTRTTGAMRFDLPPAEIAEQLASVAAGLVCKIEGVTGIAIVVYGTAEQAEPVATALTAQASICGLNVIDALYVVGTDWAHVGEKTLTPMGAVPAHIAALAAEVDVQAGAILPEVDPALVAEVAEWLPAATATATATVHPAYVIDMFERALRDGAEGGAKQDAALIALLARPLTRDVALIQWASGAGKGQEALTAQTAWRAGAEIPAHLAAIIIGEGDRPDVERLGTALSVCRRLAALAPAEAACGALSAAAWLSWALGRSTHAEIYARRALALDPEHGLSQIIDTMVTAGHLPEWAFTR